MTFIYIWVANGLNVSLFVLNSFVIEKGTKREKVFTNGNLTPISKLLNEVQRDMPFIFLLSNLLKLFLFSLFSENKPKGKHDSSDF